MATTAVALAAARRGVHELLVLLPAWDADKAREKLAALEVVVAATTREQVAHDIETHPGPINGEWMDSRDRAAAAHIARNGATQ
jgi:hypothetical protein